MVSDEGVLVLVLNTCVSREGEEECDGEEVEELWWLAFCEYSNEHCIQILSELVQIFPLSLHCMI